MARRRVSFKLAPGVRISASSRGIRTSVGNSRARVSFGAGGTYMSAKAGGVRVSQRSGSRSPRTNAAALRSAAVDLEIAELEELEQALVTLHHEDFPEVTLNVPDAPAPTDVGALTARRQAEAVQGIGIFQRTARKEAKAAAAAEALVEAARQDAENTAEHARQVAETEDEWARLLAHEPELVIERMDEAFADNSSLATCVDAGTEDGGHYATVIIVFGPASLIPDRTAAVTAAGRPTTRKRTKADRNALYVRALGSTVLTTVKESFAVTPALDTVRVVVLRRDPDAFMPSEFLTVVYTAEFTRSWWAGARWKDIDPAAALLAASGAAIRRKGVAGDLIALDVSADPGLAGIVGRFAEAMLPTAPD